MKKFSVKPKLTGSKVFWVGNRSEDEYIFLGKLGETGQVVNVNFDISLPSVVAIFGKRGSGKSYTLGSFIEGLCTEQPHNSISSITKKHASLLFDTLGIFQWMDLPVSTDSDQEILKKQAANHKKWKIDSEKLNVEIWAPRGTSTLDREYNEFTVNCSDFTASDWGYLLDVDILQDRMGQLLNDAYEKVVNEGWKEESSTHPPEPSYAIEDLIECVKKDTELIENYHRETRRAIIQQLSTYSRDPLFQPKRGIPKNLRVMKGSSGLTDRDLKKYESVEGTPLRSMLNNGQLSILLLHKVSDELRFVLIVSLIRTIMRERIETSEMEKNLQITTERKDSEKELIEEKIRLGIPPTWIAVDEAQNFLPSEKKTTATDVLVRLVREGRNFGLSFVLTTQQPSAIDQRILAQVDTIVTHKLTVQRDIEYIQRNLKSNLPKEVRYGDNKLSFDEILRLLDTGQAFISNTETSRAFITNIRPRVAVHGGFSD